MNTYPTGSNIEFTVVFTTPGTGAAVDPTTVTFRIKSPETGIITTYTLPAGPEVVKDSTGNYHCNFVIDYPGHWYYQWLGAGAYIAANEGYVCARETVFPT